MLIYSARCPMSQISCQNQISLAPSARLISLAPLALAPPARLICLSHVFSRRLRCEQACSTPVRHISGPLAISAIMRTLCASLCVEPSCSRQTPLFNRVLGSWHPDSLWVFCPLWVSAQLHSLSGADGSPSPPAGSTLIYGVLRISV